MTRGYADASIGGLCSAAATILSLSVAFLAVWAFAGNSNTPWQRYDHILVSVAFVSYFFLAVTRFLATAPREKIPPRTRDLPHSRCAATEHLPMLSFYIMPDERASSSPRKMAPIPQTVPCGERRVVARTEHSRA
jgi:hypothetical protein